MPDEAGSRAFHSLGKYRAFERLQLEREAAVTFDRLGSVLHLCRFYSQLAPSQ